MAVTIADVAKEAGVSISTVSRVINNTKVVSPELRQKVFDVIEKNNFIPNALAQGLVTNRTKVIGVVVPDISNSVFGELTKGINEVCSQKGYTIMVCESGGKEEKELQLLKVLEDRKIDGILFAGVDVNERLVDAMKEKEYEVVLVTQEASVGSGELATVIHDNLEAFYEGVKFLIDNGHQRIGYIGGPVYDFSSGKKRLQGYKRALLEAGIPIIPSYIACGEFSYQSGYVKMKEIYEENYELPTAIVCGSDLLAVGAMQFLNSINVVIPEEMSILGFDDLQIATYFKPELSTVRISYNDEGAKAAELLLRLVENEEDTKETLYVPHKIIRRGTIKRLKN